MTLSLIVAISSQQASSDAVTEPVLYNIRRRLPISLGGFDFSPIIVIMAIYFFQIFVVDSLLQFAAQLGPR